jgi:3-oxoacyl-[acyl-carrier protein] reductase
MRPNVSLVTGASRGIGAAVARRLAELGSDLVINFHSKAARAEEVAARARSCGRRAVLARADLTCDEAVRQMADLVKTEYGALDVLVLNASGGLEKDRPPTYPMEINHDAQVRTVEAMLPLMRPGGCIVFVTSHWAHFFGRRPTFRMYLPVAKSKKAGEDALRARIPELAGCGIRLAVVSGDLVQGTVTQMLLERARPGVAASRVVDAGTLLLTIDDFAVAITDAATDDTLPSGHTLFVGSTADIC